MRVLGLDIAGHCGWAITPGLDGSGEWRWGVRTTPKPVKIGKTAHYGNVFDYFRCWLHEKIYDTSPEAVAIEAPTPNKDQSYQALRVPMGMCAVAETVAVSRDLPYRLIYSASVRSYFCGKGKLSKQYVIPACREQGFMVTDHNEADAVATAYYAMYHPDLFKEYDKCFGESGKT